MRILIAEDDKLSRDILSLTLSHAGYEVTAVSNGSEALKVHEKDPFPLIFSDWIMPIIDGIELCRKVRAEEAGDTYTYFMIGTAHDRGLQDYQMAVQAGVDNFLHKPWDTNELLMCLNTAKRTLGYIGQIGKLKELIPICRYCKKVNSSPEFWERIEKYVNEQTGSNFSHGICPDCARQVCKDFGIKDDFIEDFRNPGSTS